jgi:hypothetical protein
MPLTGPGRAQDAIRAKAAIRTAQVGLWITVDRYLAQ